MIWSEIQQFEKSSGDELSGLMSVALFYGVWSMLRCQL